MSREQILKKAWIGDAVLSLFARQRIVQDEGRIDGPKAERLTSNRFLSAVSEASETEAEIGRIYESNGLAAAFSWIEERLIPLFERQEANREKRSASIPISGGARPR